LVGLLAVARIYHYHIFHGSGSVLSAAGALDDNFLFLLVLVVRVEKTGLNTIFFSIFDKILVTR
jgi:hypothetical protein